MKSVRIAVPLTAFALAVGLAGCSSSVAAPHLSVGDFSSKPKIATWGVQNPYFAALEKTTDDEKAATLEDVVEVGQDQALVVWSYGNEGQEGGTSKLDLLNTKSGKISWSRSWTLGDPKLITPVGAAIAVISTPSADAEKITALRLSDGKTLSSTTAQVFTAPADGLPADRVLLTKKGKLNLYSTGSLTPLWSASIPVPKQLLGIDADRIFTPTGTYSMSTGKKQSWSGALSGDIRYVPAEHLWPTKGSGLVRYEGSSTSATIDRVDPSNGSSLWHLAISNTRDGAAYDRDGVLLIKGGVLTKYDGGTGKKLWSRTGFQAVASYTQLTDDESGGVDLAASDPKATTVAVLDPATGKTRFTMSLGGEDSNRAQIIGASAHNLYVTKSVDSSHQLFAYDLTTGLEKWRLSSPFSNWYSFELVGGNIIATDAGLGLGTADVKSAKKHPSILGVG